MSDIYFRKVKYEFGAEVLVVFKKSFSTPILILDKLDIKDMNKEWRTKL